MTALLEQGDSPRRRNPLARQGSDRKRPVLEAGGRRRSIHTDVATGETVVEIDDRCGRMRYDEIDLIAETSSTTVSRSDPGSSTNSPRRTQKRIQAPARTLIENSADSRTT